MKIYKIEVEIPDGWVPVCEWNEHRGKGGAKGKYDALLTAIKRHDIDYISAGRPFRYYVRKEQADAYLADQDSERRQASGATVDKRLEDIERALGLIMRRLENNDSGAE